MFNYENQLNLSNLYSECAHLFQEQKPEFINLLNNYLHIDDYISWDFKRAFYADTGRPRDCSILGYISSLVVQKIFTIPTDSLLILILNFSPDLRNICGVQKVPDASQYTRFKQDFEPFLKKMFVNLVDVTEPICKAIDPVLSDMVSLDTSAVESYVSENNAKYLNSLIRKLKAYFKFKNISKSDDDIYKQAYKSMPIVSAADPSIRKMYANGHFCYGRKFGIITNGLGIPRHIDFFDDDFKKRHEDFIFEDVDSPDYDKSLADCKSLIPMLSDFYTLHPTFKHSNFLGDSAYDAFYNYEFLLKKDQYGNSLFNTAFIPLNGRATTNNPKCSIDENGIPLCPRDSSLKMKPDGFSKKRGYFKWYCPKTSWVNKKRVCICENPCTDSKYGRVCNVYPNRDFRLYPGTIRGSSEWNHIYKIRVTVEKAINHIKTNMAISGRKTRNAKTTKADVFLAGISQLFTVIIANNMDKPEYIRSIKKLVC